MAKFRIEAIVDIEPEWFTEAEAENPERAVRDAADGALHTFADVVGALWVNRVSS